MKLFCGKCSSSVFVVTRAASYEIDSDGEDVSPSPREVGEALDEPKCAGCGSPAEWVGAPKPVTF